jgi:hypothetical protein
VRPPGFEPGLSRGGLFVLVVVPWVCLGGLFVITPALPSVVSPLFSSVRAVWLVLCSRSWFLISLVVEMIVGRGLWIGRLGG